MKITEKDIIDIVSKNYIFREEVLTPIGEDACILFPKQDSNLVVTTDTMGRDSHFKDDISPYELGYISAASNISDLSAMGAIPAFALINLTIERPEKAYIEDIVKGYNKIFSTFPVAVVGGDTTYGPTSITMTLIGYSTNNNFMLTSNAKNGDTVFISGAVGDSLLARKKNKYHMPESRNNLGNILAEYANSCTDMSDGLLDSLKRITKKSNLGADISVDKIKITEELQKKIVEGIFSWQQLLSYGDDYELFFTVSKEKTTALKKLCKSINIEILEIGTLLEESNGINFTYNENLLDININKKYEHFNK